MYCGECPYCGRKFKDKDRDIVKVKLKYHMIREHGEILLQEAKRYKYLKIFGPSATLSWYAGMKASYSIKKC